VSLPAAAREAARSLGPPASPPRLATRSIVEYSLPTLGLGFTFVLVNVYLLKYATDVLLIAPATMGLLFGASRLWDAVADPVVGFLTDRTRSRFGRRRPWILAAALPLGITFAMLFTPPAAFAGRELLLWTGGALFVFYTSIAMLETAHAALGAELTDEYHERTRVFGIRRIVFGLGTLGAVAALGAFGAAADLRRVGAVVGVLGGTVAAASILWMVVRTRERPEFRDRGAESPLRAFRDVWRNRHARVLLLVFVIQQLGVTTLMTIMPYLSEYVLLTPELTFAYIGTLFVAAIVGVPLWIRMKPRGGKKGGLILAMATIGFGIAALWFAEEGDVAIVFAVAAVGGLASAGTDVLFPSIQADVIDWDELQTGERKEGAYFAAWAFSAKAAGALSAALVAFALPAIGFVPNAVQTPEARDGMRLLAALGPACLYALGILLFLGFRLGEREHAEIQAELARRGRGAGDGVNQSTRRPLGRQVD
jgi:GPH family glycoside/pentoside/hexuronide:cation symporter